MGPVRLLRPPAFLAYQLCTGTHRCPLGPYARLETLRHRPHRRCRRPRHPRRRRRGLTVRRHRGTGCSPTLLGSAQRPRRDPTTRMYANDHLLIAGCSTHEWSRDGHRSITGVHRQYQVNYGATPHPTIAARQFALAAAGPRIAAPAEHDGGGGMIDGAAIEAAPPNLTTMADAATLPRARFQPPPDVRRAPRALGAIVRTPPHHEERGRAARSLSPPARLAAPHLRPAAVGLLPSPGAPLVPAWRRLGAPSMSKRGGNKIKRSPKTEMPNKGPKPK